MNGAATANSRRITKRELKSIEAPQGIRDSRPLLALAPLLDDMMGIGVGLSIREGGVGTSNQVYLSPRYQRLMEEPTIPLLEDTIAMRVEDGTVLNLRFLSPDDRDEKLGTLAKMAMVGEVSVGLAHDLRGILSVILGSIEFVKRCTPAAEPLTYGGTTAAEYLSEAEHAVEMGVSMCHRIEELGSTKRQVVAADLSAIVNSAVDMVKNRVKRTTRDDASIKITNLATDPIAVKVIPAEVQMAILNILFNAIRYCGTPDGKGHIILVSESYGSHSVLSIWNNGPPINPKVQEGLLQRPLASATVHGYGLYTAASNLKSFGVELSFTSGEDGTEFLMRFPKPGRRKPEEPAPASE